eukprot:SAG31_NODE_5223_length_2665_cov_1.982853_1_plen_199_part_10
MVARDRARALLHGALAVIPIHNHQLKCVRLFRDLADNATMERFEQLSTVVASSTEELIQGALPQAVAVHWARVAVSPLSPIGVAGVPVVRRTLGADTVGHGEQQRRQQLAAAANAHFGGPGQPPGRGGLGRAGEPMQATALEDLRGFRGRPAKEWANGDQFRRRDSSLGRARAITRGHRRAPAAAPQPSATRPGAEHNS